MRHDDMEVPYEPLGDAALPRAAPRNDTPLGELFKRLTTDTGELIRQEATLAKAEIRETGSRLAGDAKEIGIAAGLAFAGSLALVAFLVIALGNLLGDRYWLSSLIVGVVALGIGMMLARNAMNDIKQRGLAPRQSLASLREDKAWAGEAAREFKHDMTTDPTRPSAGR